MSERTQSGSGLDSEWTPERVALAGRHMAIVLGAGIAIGLFAAAMQLYYICALIGMLLLAGLVAWQFESTLALYALIAFIPFGRTPDIAIGGSGVGKGLYVSELMLGFLLAIWILKYIWGNLPQNRIKSAFYLPSGLYLVFCLINVWNSFLFWDPHVNQRYQYPTVNFIEIVLRVLSVGALVMMATSIRDRKWLWPISVALMISGIFNLANSMTGSKVPFAASWWVLLLFLPAGYMAAVFMDSQKRVVLRLLAAAVLVIFIYAAFVRNVSWVSGWMGLFVTLLTVSWLENKKVFLALVGIGVIGIGISWSFVDSRVIEDSRAEGDFDRFDLLKGGSKYAAKFPLGVGLGNYRTYNTFHYGEKWGTTSYTSAHGTYSQLLAETGYPGTILFVSLLIAGFCWLLKNYRQMPRGPSKAFILAALGQMTGISAASFIGDYIIPTYHNGGIFTFSTTIYSWLIWGVAIAHVRISREETFGSLDSDS